MKLTTHCSDQHYEKKFTKLVYNLVSIHTTQNSQNKWSKISDLETNIFGLKMMMKSGLEFFILKFYQPLQSCCCPVQKSLPRKAELAWQVSRYLFKIKNSRPLFIIIFKPKMLVSRSEILLLLFYEFQVVCTECSLKMGLDPLISKFIFLYFSFLHQHCQIH